MKSPIRRTIPDGVFRVSAFLRHLNQFGKCLLVIDCKFSQHLAVDINVFLLQPIDEYRITHAIHAARCIDTYDPQTTEITFALFASDISVAQRTANLLAGRAVLLGTASKVTFRQLKHLAAFLVGIYSPFDTCHILTSLTGDRHYLYGINLRIVLASVLF